MGRAIQLTAQDGHELSGYEATPDGSPRGGVLVIQEIVGVNAHIRAVCDDFASEGYRALAPALFDRVERGLELGYDADDLQRGLEIVRGLEPGGTLRDLQAAADELGKTGKVGVVGYCYGGTMAWVSAAKLDNIACASGYYGGGLARQLGLTPRVPIILHFGERDHAIPMEDVEKVKAAHPDVPVYVYEGAGHGFNCDLRESYHAASARLARQRTLELLRAHVGVKTSGSPGA